MLALNESGVSSVQGPALSGVTIDNWDMELVKRRLAYKGEMSREESDVIEGEWKKYLKLMFGNPGVDYPMSDRVDVFAHTHALFTEDFLKLCDSVRPGSRMKHVPVLSDEEADALLPAYHELTLAGLEQFGPINKMAWPQNQCVCTCSIVV